MTFQLKNKLPNVALGAVKQYVVNGITGNGLAIVASQQIAPRRIIMLIIQIFLNLGYFHHEKT